ncbi:MAG: protein jag [Chloroflexi bacterium]|nr:protein jag [Chloroflexota bacterium]
MTAGKRQEIEVRGGTVEQAVESGLAKLGLSLSDVIVDVVDEGSRGLLGIGARDAVVRLMPLSAPSPAPVEVEEAPATQPPKPARIEKPAAKPTATSAAFTASVSPPPKPSPVKPSTEEGQSDEQLAEEQALVMEMVETILHKMQVQATVTAALSEPDDMTGRRMIDIDINGKDLGVLIGPHGDTLNALQYVTRLMGGHQLHRRTNFGIDIEGYRERRKQALVRLAERMANKAIKRGRPVSLEPMSAYERRIIHMALREDGRVSTKSSGEGSRRRVRIIPAK